MMKVFLFVMFVLLVNKDAYAIPIVVTKDFSANIFATNMTSAEGSDLLLGQNFSGTFSYNIVPFSSGTSVDRIFYNAINSFTLTHDNFTLDMEMSDFSHEPTNDFFFSRASLSLRSNISNLILHYQMKEDFFVNGLRLDYFYIHLRSRPNLLPSSEVLPTGIDFSDFPRARDISLVFENHYGVTARIDDPGVYINSSVSVFEPSIIIIFFLGLSLLIFRTFNR